MNKIYKGVIHSLLPQKGFGFITPVWANGNSEENIFFHLSETRGGKCYIPALASADNREEVVSKKGTKTYVPKEPQVVFYELGAQSLPSGVRLVAKKIRDAKNISDEEADQADANTEKPSAEELLRPAEETISVEVTPATIQQEPEIEESDNAVIEETQEAEAIDNSASSELETCFEDEPQLSEEESDEDDDYYEEYEEYQDEFDRLDAKTSRRYSPKDNKKDQ